MKGVTVTLAEEVAQGAAKLANGRAISNSLPGFCRVALVARPSADSEIHVEVWLPDAGWNGSLLGTGNGGGGGDNAYGDLDHGLRRGFAVGNSDMGTSPNANAVVDHPERWVDFGGRATHEMTLIAKAIIASYYGKAPAHSYFYGCSTGGQQALMEAERYPADYNGILAGAPANNRTHLHDSFLWNYRTAYDASGKYLFSPELFAMVDAAVLKACRGKDGGAESDNFLTDPRVCKFNLKTLPACADSSQSNCVTPAQLAALEKIYSGPTNSRTGERFYPPLFFGSEQSIAATYPADPNSLPRGQFYPFRWTFGANFDAHNFDFDRDLDTVDAKLAPILNANDADLAKFRKAGGKLIMYGGTADSLVPMSDAMNFYERAIGKAGSLEAAQGFFRYFTVPGMGHCGGGPGLNDIGQSLASGPLDGEHNVLSALMGWVEEAKAPETIIARRGGSGGAALERPVCAYPKFAEYRAGDAGTAGSYVCVSHPLGLVPVVAGRYLR